MLGSLFPHKLGSKNNWQMGVIYWVLLFTSLWMQLIQAETCFLVCTHLFSSFWLIFSFDFSCFCCFFNCALGICCKFFAADVLVACLKVLHQHCFQKIRVLSPFWVWKLIIFCFSSDYSELMVRPTIHGKERNIVPKVMKYFCCFRIFISWVWFACSSMGISVTSKDMIVKICLFYEESPGEPVVRGVFGTCVWKYM